MADREDITEILTVVTFLFLGILLSGGMVEWYGESWVTLYLPFLGMTALGLVVAKVFIRKIGSGR